VGFSVVGEHPLLTVGILKVAEIEIRVIAVDDRWIAALNDVMVEAVIAVPATLASAGGV